MPKIGTLLGMFFEDIETNGNDASRGVSANANVIAGGEPDRLQRQIDQFVAAEESISPARRCKSAIENVVAEMAIQVVEMNEPVSGHGNRGNLLSHLLRFVGVAAHRHFSARDNFTDRLDKQ